MGKFQLKASAYHLNLREIKKLFYVTPSFRDRCLLKALGSPKFPSYPYEYMPRS